MRVEPIESKRLELVWISPEDIEALLAERHDAVAYAVPAGWPDEHDRRFLSFRLRQIGEDPAQALWFARAIVLRSDGRPMIGHCGFHGSPGRNERKDPGAVEIGYTIFEPHRRQGYAIEAVRALIGWAQEEGIERFIASVGPQNEPSLALLRRLGFREVGRHWDDEDGEELEFSLDTASL